MSPYDITDCPALFLGVTSSPLLPRPAAKHFFMSLFLLTRPSRRANKVPLPPLCVSFSLLPHFEYLPHIPQVSILENWHQIWSCTPERWERLKRKTTTFFHLSWLNLMSLTTSGLTKPNIKQNRFLVTFVRQICLFLQNSLKEPLSSH